MRRFKSAAQAQRFLCVHGPIHNLFRVGRHHLKAMHHRLLRERSFHGLEDGDLCLLKERKSGRASGQNRLGFINLTMPMGIKEVLTAPHSPWQNPFAERLIGSVRRECLDHVIVLNRRHLRRILNSYFGYYHRSRTHLSLDKDAPVERAVQGPECGKVVEFPEVGGLHHRYERRAA